MKLAKNTLEITFIVKKSPFNNNQAQSSLSLLEVEGLESFLGMFHFYNVVQNLLHEKIPQASMLGKKPETLVCLRCIKIDCLVAEHSKISMSLFTL